ncbi:MAG: SIR2 family protein [Candidatus Marinimicrobia bacterium]|nr:SIR2 family protein [Candidatus Neomarinimicrobiota bacterium]
MKRQLTQFVDKYIKSINAENAAIFAGAGMSVSSGLVNWKELLREMAEELNLNVDKETDLIAVAQYYENEKGSRGSINDQLIEQFTKDVKESINHQILASLPIKTYWTTNYDDLIEKTIEKFGKITDVKRCTENLAISKPRREAVIYKMHGDITLSHDAVLTKDDYENYNEKRQLFTTALQGDLVSKTFLFIGFSFEDPNLEYILSRIRILLGNHTPDHYCFFKTISEDSYKICDEYLYDKIKQEHRIKDLKRYGIQALMIDDYNEITEVLLLIQTKLRRRNIFISGAAHEYGYLGKFGAENLIFNFSSKLAEKNYKIISGFGLGIGSSVINGTLTNVYNNQKGQLDDYLILRPFPQNITDPVEREKSWNHYRHIMLGEAGIAIFFFGNKLVENKVVLSDGLIKEFEIAVELGLKVIPIGCTGYASKELWKKVIDKYEEYYPDNPVLKDTIISLGQDNIDESTIINNLIKAINLLQNHI